MSRNRVLVLAAAVILIGAAAWWYVNSGRENVAVDLVAQVTSAKRQPNPEAFAVMETTINGEARWSITMKDLAGTRITWHVTIPDNGFLKVGIGLIEQAWKMQGDGVYFMIGVSSGPEDKRSWDELLTLTMNPFANASDRRWQDISLDLSQYAGETVDVIFNTRSSTGPRDDRNGDFAVWGSPRIVIR